MEATLEFVGTATTLLRFGTTTFLTDPNFLHRGQRAYLGKGLFSKRLTEPSLQPAELPPLDAVLLSHLHGDHFDRIAREQLDRDLPVLTTPSASRRLGSWGFAAAHGMTTWETQQVGDVRVTAVPGRHAPGPFQGVFPPVMGTVLEADGFRAYVTGDTLYYPWLRDVVDRCGPIDAMVIHLGGTRALGLLVTMDGEQGADLVETIRPALTVPVHHDDYTVFRSPLADFLTACRRRDAPTRVQTVARGEVVSLAPQNGSP
ncbi:MAG TPA: MBL fold metallo-hydrolase [Nocardioides sp.]|nr:MBL fold metallo-hydrolase [Nocardioides sp.]